MLGDLDEGETLGFCRAHVNRDELTSTAIVQCQDSAPAIEKNTWRREAEYEYKDT